MHPKRKKLIEAAVAPMWKEIKPLIYETVDPVTGGTWQYTAKRKMSEEELLQSVVIFLTFFNGTRPEKGQVHILNQPART